MSQDDDNNKLDDILSQTLEEFSLEDNNEQGASTCNQSGTRDGNTGLEQVLKLLSQEEEEETAPLSSSEDYEQLLQSLVSQLSALEGERGDNRQETSSVEPNNSNNNNNNNMDELENMMQVVVKQLLSKEILQEPMEQLYQRYCTWLEENSASEDYDRYVQQKQLVFQICEEYRGEGDTEKVLQLLQEMQNLGAPPPNVVSQVEDSNNNESLDSQWRDLQNNCQTQ
ncbi:hypothetical protein GAYE_SCF39G5328 [Galdieria yellowstonensis]|uniref:Uncharacterized protein n=1 Tax=Galdieria yellowstonensis TaxID=3028027 RepID=A0AAV9IJF1_9RHOD|nr:hypothetical protein GAYE_SCF39G5328 [Galdieria yellowstonensis]